MEMTNDELQEIVSSLHLKELVLYELANDTQNRLGNIKAFRERIQKGISDAARPAREE